MSENDNANYIKILEIFVQNLTNQEIRVKIINLLDNFAKLERSELIKRFSTLAQYTDDLSGKNTNFLLFDILSKAQPDVKPLLDQISDEDVRSWLSSINAKYISVFEGCFPPLLNDWYRVLWTIKLDETHGNVAFLETTILKRNKETAYLDTPFFNMLVLMNHWLTQMCSTKIIDISRDAEFIGQLKMIKVIVDNTLNSAQERNQLTSNASQ